MSAKHTSMKRVLKRTKDEAEARKERLALMASRMFGRYSADIPAAAAEEGVEPIIMEQAVLASRLYGFCFMTTEAHRPSSIMVHATGAPVPAGRTVTRNWWR